MHVRTRRTLIALAFLALLAPAASAQTIKNNFPDRKAIVVNVSPHIELSGFDFANTYQRSSSYFEQDLTWTNIGTQPVVAFEVVVLKYDPFDRRMIGSRWIVAGKNSADWSALEPGAQDDDGTRSVGSEHVHTAIAYVRHIRLADGTIWTVAENDLLAAIRQAAPHIREFGDVKPDSASSR